MKKIFFMTAMLAMTACGSHQLGIGIKSENLDPTAVAGDDFYQYACGGWMEANPLTAEYSRYGSFDALAENNREQLKGLIEEIVSTNHDASTNAGKIANLYNIYMDTTARNNQGIGLVKPYFDRIASITSTDEIVPMIAELGHDGLVDGYFGYSIGADSKDSKNNILGVYQGGITLGEKEYYLDTDEATTAIREAYRKHIVRMFTLYGFDQAVAEAKMADVMRIETRIAENSRSAVELRDPEANYNKMAMDQVRSEFSGINFDLLFASDGMTDVDFVDMGQPEAIHAVEKIIAEEPVESQKAYLEWQLINNTATSLTTELDNANFDFYGRVLSGREEQQPMWKRATSLVSGYLGEAIGQLYVEKYFPAAAKERMEKLVKNLQTALGERIDAQEWMSDETKTLAHEKLDAFYVKVGYPDTWKNYDNLVIDPGKSFFENKIAMHHYFVADMVERKFKKPVDNTEWFMTPQTVNAYYNPTTNEICFPAGILQYPFFDMNADDAFNYGAIGVVIGHEMTHGFDDMGRQFDKEGNLNDWWTDEDAEKFQNRVQTLVDFFDNINVLPDLKANGSLTLGENIADHGGLMISYQAFKNATKDAPLGEVDGFTPEQRFFIAYANVWAGNIRDEEIRNRTKSDPHSLGRWRVNGTLPHIDAWYDAFGVTEENAMY
ncbi:MAG: M13 family metallopeptidase, partial [Bacteroidales bacterium]|nr:M13 family metallopeptidase [Candidatus Equibacterium intestinale]